MPRNDEGTERNHNSESNPIRTDDPSKDDDDDRMTTTTTTAATINSRHCIDWNDLQLTSKRQILQNSNHIKKRQRQQPLRHAAVTQPLNTAPSEDPTTSQKDTDHKSKSSIQSSNTANHKGMNRNTKSKNEPKVFFGEYWEIEKVLAEIGRRRVGKECRP